MSGDPPRGLSNNEVVGLAKEAIEVAREEALRTADNLGAPRELQQPGLTIDLGHKGILSLPDEVIEVIKDEIERYDS
jgi:hypothetical protein